MCGGGGVEAAVTNDWCISLSQPPYEKSIKVCCSYDTDLQNPEKKLQLIHLYTFIDI